MLEHILYFVPLIKQCVSVLLCAGWTLMLGLTGIPALIELLLLPFFPESPRYMLIQRGDEDTAKKGEKAEKHE